MRTIRIASSILLVTSLAACHDLFGGGGDKPKPAQIAAASTPPASATVGTQVPLSVKVTDASGQAVKGTAVQWAVTGGGGSIAPASSTTDATGVATATWTLGNAAGTQTATASFDGAHSVTFTVTATAGAPSAVTVTPDSTDLHAIGDTVRLHATATDASNNPVAVTWLQLDPTVATVNASGLVTAVGNGRARIVASAGAKADTAIVRVQQAAATITATPTPLSVGVGVSAPLTVTVKDARGNTISSPPLSFASQNTSIATVSSAGVVTGQNAGSTAVIITTGAVADTVPVTVTAPVKLTGVSAGYVATCGTTNAGALSCWGNLYPGINSATPVPVSSSVALHAPTLGTQYGCALGPDGKAYCWGTSGYLGTGTMEESSSAVPVSGGISYTKIYAGAYHTCAIDGSGTAYCWGLERNGALGHGPATCANSLCLVPVQVSGSTKFTEIETNSDDSCGIGTDAQLYCWGLGWGTTPKLVSTAGGTYTEVAVANGQVCALQGGTPYCWNFGIYGAGTPVAGSPAFVQIDGGFQFFCGVTAGGAAYCWGDNTFGQLGTGTSSGTSVPTPQLVTGGHTFSFVSSGYRHSCGVASDGLYCWGENNYGDVGTGSGTTATYATPVKVVGQP
jgi:hypothetical protein